MKQFKTAPILLRCMSLFLAHHDMLRHGRGRSLSGQSGLWHVVRPRVFMMGWTPPDGIDVPKWRC